MKNITIIKRLLIVLAVCQSFNTFAQNSDIYKDGDKVVMSVEIYRTIRETLQLCDTIKNDQAELITICKDIIKNDSIKISNLNELIIVNNNLYSYKEKSLIKRNNRRLIKATSIGIITGIILSIIFLNK